MTAASARLEPVPRDRSLASIQPACASYTNRPLGSRALRLSRVSARNNSTTHPRIVAPWPPPQAAEENTCSYQTHALILFWLLVSHLSWHILADDAFIEAACSHSYNFLWTYCRRCSPRCARQTFATSCMKIASSTRAPSSATTRSRRMVARSSFATQWPPPPGERARGERHFGVTPSHSIRGAR